MKIKDFFWNWITRNLLGAIILICVLLTGAVFILKAVTMHNKEFTVPDFTGMSLAETERLASAYGMRTEVTDSVYVRRMERGTVYRHNPDAGSKVKKGRRILLTINAVNPKSVTMPNLIGYSMRQANAELSSRGLNLGRLIYVKDIATNNVLKQLYMNREVEPGESIESESVIDLVVGLNPSDNKTYIPYLAGTKYMNAVSIVHANSLNIKNIIFDNTVRNYSDSLNAVVYRQSPDTSSVSLPMGSEMTLYFTTDLNRLPKEKPADAEDADNIKIK